MKLNKIFALMLAATMFTACSDDDNWNGSDVTVNMLNEEISVKENAGIFNVPIVVEGEMNGPVQVTVEVAEVGETPAMDDVHYLVTQKTIVISAEDGSGSIEIMSVDDDEINDARTFTVTIVDVKGGTIGTQTATTVYLKDNDSVFYEKLQGAWTLNAKNARTGASISWNVNIVGYGEEESGYNQTLYITGVNGYSWAMFELVYHFDMDTKTGYLELPYGTVIAEGVNFDLADSPNNVVTGTLDDEGYIVVDGGTTAEWSDDFKQITFVPEDMVWAWITDSSYNLNGYPWFSLVNITLTR